MVINNGDYKVLLSAYNIWAHVELFSLFSSDRLQTSLNVMGDTYAAAFVEKMSQKELNNNGDEDLEMNGDKPTSTDGFTPSLSLLEDEKDEHGESMNWLFEMFTVLCNHDDMLCRNYSNEIFN